MKKARTQFIVLFIAIIYVGLLFYWEHKSANFPEKPFEILQVPETIENKATKVSVGLFINNFPTFSFNKNKFSMHAYVWFKYDSNKKDILSELKEFDFEYGDINYKSPPLIKQFNEKETLAIFQVKAILRFPHLNHKGFPIGDHRLNIILDNKAITDMDIYFSTDENNFELSDDTMLAKWRSIKTSITSGYLKPTLKIDQHSTQIDYPCVVFTIDLEHTSIRDVITLYFPMFVIFFISLFSLLISIKEYLTRLSLIASTVPILVLFRTVILSITPPMGDFTKADYIYFLLVFCSLIILCFQAYLAFVMKKINTYTDKEKNSTMIFLEGMNYLLVYGTILFLVLALTYDAFFG